MSGDTQVRLVFVTAPDAATAEQIATTLVSERLAACVTRIPGVISVYAWQGKVEQEQEQLLLIKSSAATFPALRERIVALHPYELPEVVAVRVTDGLTDYLKWVKQCTESIT